MINPNLGVLSQVGSAPKGRKPVDRSFYRYGAKPPAIPQAPRGNSLPGGPGIPRTGAVRGANFASGGSPGPLSVIAGGAGADARGPDGGFRGPGSGRDDSLDAKVSDGEWIADAETVALLGDGSSEEGIRRLEEMRDNLRLHKGPALSRGKLSPNAKRPQEYMGRLKRLKESVRGGK